MSYIYAPGLGDAGSYQCSGKPFVTGSIDLTTVTTPFLVEFPTVTRWIYIQNHGTDAGENCNVAFAEKGFDTGNFFHFPDGSTTTPTILCPVLEVKVCQIWLDGTSPKVDVIAGLTDISCEEIPNNWSGSAGVG